MIIEAFGELRKMVCMSKVAIHHQTLLHTTNISSDVKFTL